MTACCCRLTQPAKRRTTKASGGGSESMAQSLPREVGGMQGAPDSETGGSIQANCRRQPPAVASSLSSGVRFGLGRVFAQDDEHFLAFEHSKHGARFATAIG